MSKFNLYSVCINAIELIVDGKYLATKWNAVSLRGVSWVLELWNVWPLLFNPYPVPGTVYPVPGRVYSVPLPGASWAFLECLFLHFFTFAGISISVPERQILTDIYFLQIKCIFSLFFHRQWDVSGCSRAFAPLLWNAREPGAPLLAGLI